MKKFASAAFLLCMGAWAGASSQAKAFELPCCGVEVSCATQTVTCYKPVVKCRQVPCVVEKKVCREVTEIQKTMVAVPYTETQKREIFVYKPATETVDREIFVAVECPTPAPAPACSTCGTCGGGCGAGHCCKPNPESYKKSIKCTQCKDDATKVEIVEPVCKVRMEEKLVPVTRKVEEIVHETIYKTETYCEMVPFQVTVPVPTCKSCGCH